MIWRILSFIIFVPLAIILVVFCVLNRQAVTVSLDPFGTLSQFSFTAPLFILLMGAVIVGVVLGGVGAWLAQAHYRRKSWKRKNEIERLKRENEEARERLRQLREEKGAAALPGRPGSTALVTSRAA